MEAIISDIQKFSLHDGPGIRTTVFFKGCNMHCTWCHNPETFSMKQDLMFFSNKCIGCGACYAACKTGALTKELHRVYNKDLCIGCGACVEVCAPGALKLVGKKMTVEQLMEIIREDAAYYRSSGGGVTLSGGEVLLQADFVKSVRALLPDLHAAIETCGYAREETFQSLCSSMDLVMMDIKHTDPGQHKKWTGVSNDLILKNFLWLKNSGIPFILRIPLIPGVNDTMENIEKTAELADNAPNLVRVELLRYNRAAGAKYDGFSMQYDPGFDTEKEPNVYTEPFTARNMEVLVR